MARKRMGTRTICNEDKDEKHKEVKDDQEDRGRKNGKKEDGEKKQ